MKYQETGRFGRITKHLRKQGFEKEMEHILHDSSGFSKLKKPDQTRYGVFSDKTYLRVKLGLTISFPFNLAKIMLAS